MAGLDLDHTPVIPPPPGQSSNFETPEIRNHHLVILISVLSLLVVLVTLARLYARLRVTKSFGIDDILCIIATVLVLSYSSLVLKLLYYSGGGIVGIHLWDVSLRNFVQYEMYSVAGALLSQITNTMIKVAFLVFYLRLFGLVTYVRWMIWVGMAVIVAFAVVFCIVYLSACLPRSSEAWESPSVGVRCEHIVVDLITVGAWIRVVTDFYILFIPLHQLPRLELSGKRKIGMALVFLTGLLAAGAGLANLILRSDKRVFDTADFSWTVVPVYATTLLELNIGLICLSLPVIFVIFIGRFAKLGEAFGSWIRERRTPQHSRCSRDSPERTANQVEVTPQLSPTPDNGSKSPPRVRQLVRSIYRSYLTSAHLETVLGTFDGTVTGSHEYHAHLKDTAVKQDDCGNRPDNQ
ncbi:hypothetical protein GGS20DRAFT_536100 [Poronia punctata]|nr:hypothetical protein GGS20DRAFT_536100 [Poronia punctata]